MPKGSAFSSLALFAVLLLTLDDGKEYAVLVSIR